MFASQRQLELLGRAKRWYVDATFNVVKPPFTQLWSIHAFVKSGDDTKQLPLLFCVMSGKRKRNYRAVLRAVIRSLPTQPAVKEIVLEAATWNAISSVLQDVSMMGCCFHWTQAVWGKIQEVGLQRDYMQDNATYKILRKLMCLPFLPAEHIIPAFDLLRKWRATASAKN